MEKIVTNPESIKQAIKKMEDLVGVTESRDMFISYHVQSLDLKSQGFGNTIIKFYPELYQNDMAKFLEHIQKALALALEQQHKTKFEVKVLFFR